MTFTTSGGIAVEITTEAVGLNRTAMKVSAARQPSTAEMLEIDQFIRTNILPGARLETVVEADDNAALKAVAQRYADPGNTRN